MQSFTSNWPRVLWLAVDQTGLHLLEHRSRNVLCIFDYSSILSYSRAAQAFQIATLLREYMAVLFGESIEAKTAVPLNKNGRPVSSLHSLHRSISTATAQLEEGYFRRSGCR